jgi:enamine deaminase RidA (YjgF/YER057c/UK114 family)
MGPTSEIINPESLPRGSGFSFAVSSTGERTVYFSGHTAMNVDGRIVGGSDLIAQYEQVLRNLERTAEAAGVGFRDMVKLRLYVTDVEGYKARSKEIGAVYRRYFGSYYPAMTLVEIRRLWDDDALIEIEAEATL